jgi:hypothetical protein
MSNSSWDKGFVSGAKAERERIIKLLEARVLWLVHLDRLAEADELRLQIAPIKGGK